MIATNAKEVIGALKGNPVLLTLLLLNTIGIGAAVWYLEAINRRNADLFGIVLKACLPGNTP
jgi:hypothetical protein